MALGLATSVIGIIVYDIASMNGLDNPLAFLGFVVIMLLGHALNFAIAMLSAYVHSSRLQYIEFFSRFYNGGGELFKPLRAETKYINLQEVMQSEHTIFGNVR
jgi:V/A-type H+-transporting ATPase subunit I